MWGLVMPDVSFTFFPRSRNVEGILDIRRTYVVQWPALCGFFGSVGSVRGYVLQPGPEVSPLFM